ncbi:MAG TPA: hypothetical protein P5560_14395 [Thermotogota bacterium]|nr:hypothetical protein [Thermotogota bacterium]
MKSTRTITVLVVLVMTACLRQGTPGQQQNQQARTPPTITGYRVYLAPAGQAYGTAEETTGLTLAKSGLGYGTQYKWKVEAVQSDGKVGSSGEWTFSVEEFDGLVLALEPSEVTVASGETFSFSLRTEDLVGLITAKIVFRFDQGTFGDVNLGTLGQECQAQIFQQSVSAEGNGEVLEDLEVIL